LKIIVFSYKAPLPGELKIFTVSAHPANKQTVPTEMGLSGAIPAV
jgi:hypothetical protein